MTLCEKISASDEDLSNRVVETAFYVSKEIVWGNFFFRKINFFECFVRLGKKKFGFWQESFFCRVIKFQTTCLWDIFEENLFLWKKFSAILSMDIGRKVPVCWQKVFGRVDKTRVLPIYRITSRRSFFNGKIFLAIRCTLKFWAFCLKILAKLSKLPFTCPQYLFTETLFFQKIFFNDWGHWAKDCLSFVKKVG